MWRIWWAPNNASKWQMGFNSAFKGLIEVGRRYGVEINVEKPKIMRISRQQSPVRFMIDLKQRENVEYFKYVGSLITNDAKCLREIKSRIDMAKAAANKRRFFTNKLDLTWRKKQVKCHTLSVALCGTEIWTLRKIDQKHPDSFEMWCWWPIEISWTDRVKTDEVFQRFKEERNILHAIKRW